MTAAGPTASAHAILLSTSPGAGEVLTSAPTEISLHFSEAVDLSAGTVRVLDTFGTQVDVGRPRHTSGDDTTVVVDVARLAGGGYAVGWKVVSADGHPVDGAFTFSVGDAPQPGIDTVLEAGRSAASGDGWAGTGLSVARAVVYAGLALVLGGWAFPIACWWDGRRDRALRRLIVAGGALVAIGSLGRVWMQSRYVDASIGDIVDTSTGRAWVATAIVAPVIAGAACALRTRAPRWVQSATAAAAAVVLGFLVAHGGHGAAGRWTALAVALTVTHVTAMGVWIGGLASLLVCLRRASPDDRVLAAIRCSRLALWCVAVLVASGTLQAWRQIESPGDVGRSPFGRTLLVKLGVVALLLVVASASHRLVGVQRAGRARGEEAGAVTSRLRRSVAIEIAVAVAAIGVTGQLAGASPLIDRAGTVDVALVSGDQIAYVTVSPALTGVNQIHVSVASTSGSVLAPDQITIQLSPVGGQIPPIDVPAVLIPPAHATADATTIPFAGRWRLVIDVRYGEFRLVQFQTTFTVD